MCKDLAGYRQSMIDSALLQFVVAQGAGDATIRRLADFAAREGISPDCVVGMQPSEIASALGISDKVAINILASREASCRLADELRSQDIDLVWLFDPRYPEKLRSSLGKEAPPILFVKGNIELFTRPAVGFCGARNASEKGLRVTELSTRILAEEQVCVISGYASGVDETAHRSAMASGGTTIMVLVDGILRFHLRKDFRDVMTSENSLVVSQYPPNLAWIGRNAMKRNKTIAGLSDAVILVESGASGGTYAAGMETLRQNCPLFVVDFAHPGPSAEANPFFIERGGIPIRGNGNQQPNLGKVLEVIRNPMQRHSCCEQVLF